MALTFILGGARSGKSRRAQKLAEEAGADLIFIATAQPFDDEMRARIARHQDDRDSRWRTVEAPIELPAAIRRYGNPGKVLLIDCLTLWTSNILLAEMDSSAACDELVAALAEVSCPVYVVSNEVGLGIVPDNLLARQFRDVAGLLHQRVAEAADCVEWMVAGLSLQMK
ncbi:MAG: bifunctional adenosylcobinamide kinase/adenosylcobinamide-phosphate guanylyltransferase [Sphingopyxis sp.]|nr:bifunctional adenosylcobinamide kinase/adenosylcobinamide-phosphate guanylyltransferase [Sphingopyxis sp.]